jgi:hypothetical protein
MDTWRKGWFARPRRRATATNHERDSGGTTQFNDDLDSCRDHSMAELRFFGKAGIVPVPPSSQLLACSEDDLRHLPLVAARHRDERTQ